VRGSAYDLIGEDECGTLEEAGAGIV